MPKRNLFKQETLIGLDIGSYSIKCVEVGRGSDKNELKRVTILPVSSVSAESVSKALKLIFDSPSQSSRRIRVSVSGGGSSLLIRRIQLPYMTPAELRGAIRFEAEGHIPFPIDDCQIDFQILSQSPDKKTIQVMLVAAKKDFIKDRIKLVTSANIFPELIDVDIFCLINAYEALGHDNSESTFGLLNIGHKVSSFAIVQDKLPFFVREIPFGAMGITQALMNTKGIEEFDADRMKIEYSEINREDIKKAVFEGLGPLIDEMSHSIDYVENEIGDEIKTIWLSGGGALCPGTAETLSSELGKRVSLWDNTQHLEVFGEIDRKYLAEHSSELNVALGMVLRGSGGKK